MSEIRIFCSKTEKLRDNLSQSFSEETEKIRDLVHSSKK
jgi:hypothetical protein